MRTNVLKALSAAMLVLALAMTAAPAHAEPGDTADNELVKVYDSSNYGAVEWDDYKNDNHSDDEDNLYVYDRSGDGDSIELVAYYKNVRYSAHAYGGERKMIDVGNVANNDKVTWFTCRWDDGERQTCTSTHTFQE